MNNVVNTPVHNSLTLLNLPVENLQYITEYLTIKDIFNLCISCTYIYYNIWHDDTLWHVFLKRDFSLETLTMINSTKYLTENKRWNYDKNLYNLYLWTKNYFQKTKTIDYKQEIPIAQELSNKEKYIFKHKKHTISLYGFNPKVLQNRNTILVIEDQNESKNIDGNTIISNLLIESGMVFGLGLGFSTKCIYDFNRIIPDTYRYTGDKPPRESFWGENAYIEREIYKFYKMVKRQSSHADTNKSHYKKSFLALNVSKEHYKYDTVFKLANHARHYNLTLVNLLDYPNAQIYWQPKLQQCWDIIVVVPTKNKKIIKYIYDNYIHNCFNQMDFRKFNKLIINLRDNNKVLIIDCTQNNNENCFHYQISNYTLTRKIVDN